MPFRYLLLLLIACLSSPLYAATFIVNTEVDAVDVNPGDGICSAEPSLPGADCTLRAAVMEAEANSEADTILISEGLQIELSLSGDGGTEVGDLDVTTEIEILGFTGPPPLNPALLPQIDASGLSDRHFYVLEGDLLLRGLRLVGGSTIEGGGAVWAAADSTVQIEHSLFANNQADIRGGAVRANNAQVTIEDSHFFRNDGGSAGGGAIAAENDSNFFIRRSSFLDNRSGDTNTTMTVISNASLRIEDSTLDGSLLRPPIAGISAASGIVSFVQSTLIVRNTTISNYSDSAIVLNNLDGNERVRIANSVLQSDGTACVATGDDLAAANVEIGFSIIEHETDCAGFYQSGVQQGVADLELLTEDGPPRLTVSRRPTGIESNLVDAGVEPDVVPGGPDFACTSSDQLGSLRPIDADLDEIARCDLGAIEQAGPQAFIVNYFSEDHIDEQPGDGACATVDFGIGQVCTLRAAVMEANAVPGLQQIRFEPSEEAAALTLPSVGVAGTANGTAGGALDIVDPVAIDGNLENGRPVTEILGQMPGERLFLVNSPDSTVSFRNLRMTGGDAVGGAGGAIVLFEDDHVLIARSELFENSADAGGALSAAGGTLTIRDSHFENNESMNRGLAIFGGLPVSGIGPEIEIANSSFSNHRGLNMFNTPIAAVDAEINSNLLITNSTFSENELAIRAVFPVTFTMLHSTLFDQLSGGLNVNLNANNALTMINNIIAGPNSTDADCEITGSDMTPAFQMLNVLDGDGSCAAFADGTGITDDPNVLSLIRPGGAISFHHPLRAEAENPSPAIDVGDQLSCQPGNDQTGAPRPVDIAEVVDLDGPCDLGSVEMQVFDLLFNDSFETLPFP